MTWYKAWQIIDQMQAGKLRETPMMVRLWDNQKQEYVNIPVQIHKAPNGDIYMVQEPKRSEDQPKK